VSLRKSHLDPVLEKYFALPGVVASINKTIPPEKERYFGIQFAKSFEGFLKWHDMLITKTNDTQEVEKIKSFKQIIEMMAIGAENEALEKFKMTKEEYDAISPMPMAYLGEYYFNGVSGSFEEMVVNLLPAHIFFGESMKRSVGKDPKVTIELANLISGIAEWYADRVDVRAESFDAAKLQQLEKIYKIALNFEFMWIQALWNQEEWYLKNLPVQ
jgi:thiaminase